MQADSYKVNLAAKVQVGGSMFEGATVSMSLHSEAALMTMLAVMQIQWFTNVLVEPHGYPCNQP
jgi:hypothetical protein